MSDEDSRDALLSLLSAIRDWMVGVLAFTEDTEARNAAFSELGIATSSPAGPAEDLGPGQVAGQGKRAAGESS